MVPVLIVVSIAIVGSTWRVASQQLSFEVASVRLVKPMPASSATPMPFQNRVLPGRVDIVQPLRTVLLMALQVEAHRLVTPDWVNEQFIEIRATVPAGATVQQVPMMLRSLLVERLGLAVHNETRVSDAYHLVTGSAGSKMREVPALNELERKFEAQMTANGRQMADNVVQTLEGPLRTMSIPGGTRRITSRTMYELTSLGSSDGGRRLNAVRMTMPELVAVLSLNLAEPVLDRTGLKEIYQFTLDLPRDEGVRQAIPRLRALAGDVSSDAPTKDLETADATASTLKALETIGLRLERRRGPMDTVVLDSINRTPTAN